MLSVCTWWWCKRTSAWTMCTQLNTPFKVVLCACGYGCVFFDIKCALFQRSLVNFKFFLFFLVLCFRLILSELNKIQSDFLCAFFFFIANNHCIISQGKLTRRKLKNKEVCSSIRLIIILHRVIVFSKLSDFWKSFMSCISFFCILSLFLFLSVPPSHKNLSFSIRICAVIYGKIQIKWHTNLEKKQIFSFTTLWNKLSKFLCSD